MYECRFHENEIFDPLPEQAVLIGNMKRGQYHLYSIDGTIHDLRKVNPAPKKANQNTHVRWHSMKGVKKHGCLFCYPPPPKPAVPEVIFVPPMLAQPEPDIPELDISEPEIELEPEPDIEQEPEQEPEPESQPRFKPTKSFSAMRAAFKNFRR